MQKILVLKNPLGSTFMDMLIQKQRGNKIKPETENEAGNDISQAILYFTHTTKLEGLRKQLATKLGRRGNQKLAEQFIHQAAKTAHRTGYDVVMYDTHRQTGDTFGERLSNAFQDLFDQGYDHVVAIGNDTPALKETHIQQAFQHLENQKATIGPSSDGGAYLIGLSKAMFDQTSFNAVAWETSQVYEDLQAYLAAQNASCSCLEILQDVDSAADLRLLLNKRFVNRAIWRFVSALVSILASFNPTRSTFVISGFTSVNLPLNLGRAPPAAVG